MGIHRKAEETRSEERTWIGEWVVTILIFLFGTTTVLQAFVVPTGSMEGTMLVGDHLFVDRLAYSPAGALSRHLLPYQDVKRGDIIVFKYPLDIRQNYVKRVIGVPGDRIQIVQKRLYVNGKGMAEPYKVLIPGSRSVYLDNFPQEPDVAISARGTDMLRRHVVNGQLVVPPGHYFALGDNRDNSADSRFWGFVPRENIIGKPAMVWWSYDAPTEHLADNNVNLDPLKDLALHLFTKTRWDRSFLLLRGYQPLQRHAINCRMCPQRTITALSWQVAAVHGSGLVAVELGPSRSSVSWASGP
jgi:signal peptidase I